MLNLSVLLLKCFFIAYAVLKIFLSACLGADLFKLLGIHWGSWNHVWMASLLLKNTELFFLQILLPSPSLTSTFFWLELLTDIPCTFYPLFYNLLPFVPLCYILDIFFFVVLSLGFFLKLHI